MSKIFLKIHNEGYKFIIIFAIATIILYFLNGFLGFIGLVLTIWCYYFFRDPERVSIGDENEHSFRKRNCHPQAEASKTS